MKKQKLTSIFLISVGILNIGLWIMLIQTGQVGNIQEELISFAFHWTSEFVMAVMLIFTGIQMIKEKPGSRNLFFFSAGLLLIAITGALVYYLIHFDAAMAVLGSIISFVTLLVIIWNYKSPTDLFYLSTGIILYGSVNVGGEALQKNLQSISIYNGFLLIGAVMLTTLLWRKKIWTTNKKSSSHK